LELSMDLPESASIGDVKLLSTGDLLRFLPKEKIRKPKGKDVQVVRSAFEVAVIEELWERHHRELSKGLRAAVFAPGSTLCPRQEPDRLLFIDEVLMRVRDALVRLTVCRDLATGSGYDDFGDYIWRVTLNKALDLRKELSGERPIKPRQGARSPSDLNPLGAPQEQVTTGKPIAVPLDVINDVAATPGLAGNAVVLDVRKILETYYNEAPEKAVSLKAVIKKELHGWTWEELAARLPGEQSTEAKVQQARRFNEKDTAELRIRLKDLR
jgi:hypothetical protein